MKISLASKEMQSCILGKKTRLRESEVFSRVYISPDLTSEERVARAVLVKKRSPGKSFRIKGGEVVEVSSGTQYYSLRVLFIQVSSFHLFHIIAFFVCYIVPVDDKQDQQELFYGSIPIWIPSYYS